MNCGRGAPPFDPRPFGSAQGRRRGCSPVNSPFQRLAKPISQGSEQAQFLSCPNCDCVVTVVYLFEDGLKGAVNARLIIAGDQLQEAEVVSPRLLSATEKIKRWNDIWFPVLVVNKN